MLFRSKRPRTLCFFHETTWSGAPIQLLHLMTWLKKKRWEIAAAVPAETTRESGPITNCLTALGIETFSALDLSAPPDLPALRALCERFEAVVANTLVMWAPVRAAHEAGVPSVWYLHESLVARQLIDLVPEIQPTLALADTIVAPTKRTAEIYRAFTDRTIEVIPYGIPPNESTPTNAASALTTFLLLGTYEGRKGQDLFLKAIGLLPKSWRERARFRMRGRTLDENFFQELSRQAANLPEVELGPACDHEDARAAIAAADVLVCASRDETMPVAILEAMSAEKAIVATNVGGIAEWLEDNRNALLVRPEDPGALAHALRRCLEEPDLRARLGAEGRRTFLRHFSIDRLGRNFSCLIVDVWRRKHP
jgi:glycosyltransferase involved in cell wall biosynthesis